MLSQTLVPLVRFELNTLWLLRPFSLPIGIQGHTMSLRSLHTAHGFLTTKTSFALKRYWFRMSESNCYSYAQGTRVSVTPHSNYRQNLCQLSIIYYIINSIKSQDFDGLESADPILVFFKHAFRLPKLLTYINYAGRAFHSCSTLAWFN